MLFLSARSCIVTQQKINHFFPCSQFQDYWAHKVSGLKLFSGFWRKLFQHNNKQQQQQQQNQQQNRFERSRERR